MTAPIDEFEFEDRPAAGTVESIALDGPMPQGPVSPEPPSVGYPPPILDLSEWQVERVKKHLDDWLATLDADMQDKLGQWADEEEAYRALKQGVKSFPFRGAANEVMPIVAMAVDPIHARLDTGIFKQDPVFSLKALKKSYTSFVPSVQQYVDFYQKHFLKLRQVAGPRLLELAKLGTCVLKTEYHQERTITRTYDKDWNVVPLDRMKFKGPKAFGVSLGDFMFPSGYQHLQDCPIVVERQRTTFEKLKALENANKLTNVDSVRAMKTSDRTQLEDARAEASQHETVRATEDVVVYEAWFDFYLPKTDEPDSDGELVKLVATYEPDTRTFLQLRYHWYFHQRWPYTLIPYGVTSDSLYGIGICEMTKPLQDAITRFYQMASDNAYLANIRMYIAKKNSGIEDVPRLYAGRVFAVDNPKEDFIPFQAGDIYPSTLEMQQNLYGMVEKRTGVSDYLTGRESPIIGSRATATSTLALIQEGTRRVEEVLENVRQGFAEVIENCMYIWIQFGLGDIDDLVFGDDKIGEDVKKFFETVSQDNVTGAVAVDLTATDAAGNRQTMQQMQLQIIQVMMQYLEKLLEAGQAALMAREQMPEYSEMVVEVMTAARKMFADLLHKYDIRNPEDYLPDLTQFMDASQTQGGGQGAGAGQAGGIIPTGGGIPGGFGGVENTPRVASRPTPVEAVERPGPASLGVV